MAKIIGIDVSEHNGALDWAKIKAAGIGFAIIRTGYGVSHTDNYFIHNIEGAIAQGIPVGVYHFSYALNAAGAKAEAAFVLKLLEPYKDKLALPVFYDFEYDTVSYAKKQGVTLGKEAFNAHTVAFCETIKAAGYRAGTYYNLDYLRKYVDINRVGGYVQWYAQYASTASAAGWAIWQYSSSYTIPGCSGRFDVNVLGDASLLAGTTGKYTIGWHKDSKGWWYANSTTTYYKEQWAKIKDTWYYFDKEGYMLENAWKVEAGGDTYYLGADGDMQTNMVVGLGSDGRLQPIERYYHLISELPDYYRTEVDKLVAAGKLKGKAGEGEELVLDMPESTVRVMIITNR
jgi:GH25 family lysozyme M1 (1,4-beta-N-acetylmuramidase)